MDYLALEVHAFDAAGVQRRIAALAPENAAARTAGFDKAEKELDLERRARMLVDQWQRAMPERDIRAVRVLAKDYDPVVGFRDSRRGSQKTLRSFDDPNKQRGRIAAKNGLVV